MYNRIQIFIIFKLKALELINLKKSRIQYSYESSLYDKGRSYMLLCIHLDPMCNGLGLFVIYSFIDLCKEHNTMEKGDRIREI